METILVHPDWKPAGLLVYELRHDSSIVLDLAAIDAFAEAHRERLGRDGATAIVSTNFLVQLMTNLLRVRRPGTPGGVHVVPSLEAAEQALGLAQGVLAPLRAFGPAA